MQVAVISRPNDPLSLRLYHRNMVRELYALGVDMVNIPETGPIPAVCNLVWDPGMCMRRIPRLFADADIPIVGTMHGVKAFALDADELVTDQAELSALLELKANLAEDWHWFRHKVEVVVAVSNYASDEVIQAFGLPADLVRVVYHGVDRSIFHPNGISKSTKRPYFLHVSRMDPIKNLRRIIEAYSLLPEDDRPEFICVVTPEEDQPALTLEFSKLANRPGVTWVREAISQEELACWYRGAISLIVPSLRETFGLPILEAMACGCPVVTSESSGSAEVAGSAGIEVDPRSTESIAKAMSRIHTESNLRKRLRISGLSRAEEFTWELSARELLGIFSSVITSEHMQVPRIRKMEVTTAAPCRLGCAFCPHEVFPWNYSVNNRDRMMSWETFMTFLRELPVEVGISFCGMSEPFLNPLCADMVLVAKSRGHTIELFTTLIGLTTTKLMQIIGALSFGYAQHVDRIFVHLPSLGGHDRMPLKQEFLSCLEHLATPSCRVEFHYHGTRIADSISHMSFGDRLQHWPLTTVPQMVRKCCIKPHEKSKRLHVS